jgi:hypothetical protein
MTDKMRFQTLHVQGLLDKAIAVVYAILINSENLVVLRLSNMRLMKWNSDLNSSFIEKSQP